MEESLMKSGLETKNSKKFADNLDVVVAKILQKQGPLDELDLSLLKLSLSHIVNLLRTDLVGRLEEYLPMRLPIHGLVGPCNDFNSRGLSGESSGLFDKIAAEVMSDASVEEVLATVLDLKRAHIGKGRHSQEYRLLSILEYVIESADDWQPDDSEMTVYRRVATVMDYLFRSTDVKLMDGESASQCTKSARQYMENVFGGSIPDTAHGRKIDLILKRANNGGDIELSSNEFKRQRVSSTCALAQQCKNLRTNGAILAHLEAIDNQHRHRHVVAMDWIGNVGYLYMLANVEGVYVADKLCILRLPRCLNDVATFKPTLEALFRYQCFITQLGHQSLSMLQAREDLESLSGIVDTGSEAIPAPAKHRIFFAPQNHRIKRPKVNQP
ncbi:hypothetical protein BCR43DRAFT_491025 [Syncephalastrum racemosum]|uniref:Uncharacterized protein n=1 Tax=Syncephalastrum racemosum TaxID=13706 RepID=A0A1X2HID1_SYNRA|nr:hypothetical protein BCR43DRAFT_491025 [Syncephalastrum racemosum]